MYTVKPVCFSSCLTFHSDIQFNQIHAPSCANEPYINSPRLRSQTSSAIPPSSKEADSLSESNDKSNTTTPQTHGVDLTDSRRKNRGDILPWIQGVYSNSHLTLAYSPYFIVYPHEEAVFQVGDPCVGLHQPHYQRHHQRCACVHTQST